MKTDTAPEASPGRSCPLRYRYGPDALARAPEVATDTLYVIGGLYGNLLALQRVLAMFEAERGRKRLVFNGDFHWFDIDDTLHAQINQRVLAHDALQGNVEAEFGSADSSARCAAVVARRSVARMRLLRLTTSSPTQSG